MTQLTLDLSDELRFMLDAAAERDHPGRPDAAATAIRLIAWGLMLGGPPTTTADLAPRRPALPYMPEAPEPLTVPVLLPDVDPIATAQARLRRRRAEAGLDPDTGLRPLEESGAALRDAASTDANPGEPPPVMP